MAERYARDILFALRTQAGLRLFGLLRQVPEAVQANDLVRYPTLLRVGNIDLTTAPLGPDLIASLSAAEQPKVDVTCSNVDMVWSRLDATEPLLGAMGEIRAYWADGKIPLLYRGLVGSYTLSKRQIEIQLREP